MDNHFIFRCKNNGYLITQKFIFMSQRLHTCIIFYNENAPQKVSKFRNVNETGLQKLEKHWALKHNVSAINVYFKDTKEFKEQIKF